MARILKIAALASLVLAIPLAGLAQNLEASKEDETSIRAMAAAFTESFNAGDAATVASQFTEDGDFVDSDGRVFRGRAAIEEEFAAFFAQNAELRINISIDKIRFISPDVAVEDGRIEVSPPPAGPPAISRYTAVHLKQDGTWRTACVRESRTLLPSNYDHLKDLEWMVGDWVDEGAESLVATSCRWSENKNYLLREYVINVVGRGVFKGTQRIGWDPATNQIRSWVFDSGGGYGEGLWRRDGERWIVETTSVLPDGTTGSATNIYTVLDNDTVIWTSTNRVVAGESVDDIEEVTVVRKPPEAHTAAPSRTASLEE